MKTQRNPKEGGSRNFHTEEPECFHEPPRLAPNATGTETPVLDLTVHISSSSISSSRFVPFNILCNKPVIWQKKKKNMKQTQLSTKLKNKSQIRKRYL